MASWILLGLIAGAFARWILPGQERGGWISALILGIVGAIVGGWIARYIGYLPLATESEWFPSGPSLISASVGSIVVLALWKWLKL